VQGRAWCTRTSAYALAKRGDPRSSTSSLQRGIVNMAEGSYSSVCRGKGPQELLLLKHTIIVEVLLYWYKYADSRNCMPPMLLPNCTRATTAAASPPVR